MEHGIQLKAIVGDANAATVMRKVVNAFDIASDCAPQISIEVTSWSSILKNGGIRKVGAAQRTRTKQNLLQTGRIC